MTTAPTAPESGVLVGAVGVSRAERTAHALAQLERRLGVPAGALTLQRSCPVCASRDHGAPSLAWAPPPQDHDDGPRRGGILTRSWGRLRGRRQDGRPALPAVSIAHTAGDSPVTVLAWCDGAAVGVDVEDLQSPRTRRALEPGEDGAAASDAVAFCAAQLAAWAQLPRERAYAARVEAWCRAEALVKARGTGFTGDPSAVQPAPGEIVLPLSPGEVPGLPQAVRGVLVLVSRPR